MDWLLEQASCLEQENELLKGQLAELRKLVTSQTNELKQAWSHATSWRAKAATNEHILNRTRIAVIGPSFRKSDYQSLVEHLGGRFYFAPSDEKLAQIDRAVQKADVAIFLTGYAGHDASSKVKAASVRYGVEVVHIQSTSVVGLESCLRDAIAVKQMGGSSASGR